ncbi:hypothetical protein H5410_020458, partial [Solanum commersonii]
NTNFISSFVSPRSPVPLSFFFSSSSIFHFPSSILRRKTEKSLLWPLNSIRDGLKQCFNVEKSNVEEIVDSSKKIGYSESEPKPFPISFLLLATQGRKR